MIIEPVTIGGHEIRILRGKGDGPVWSTEAAARADEALGPAASEGEALDWLLRALLDNGLSAPVVCMGESAMAVRFVKNTPLGVHLNPVEPGSPQLFNFDIIRTLDSIGMRRGIATGMAGVADSVSVMAHRAQAAQMAVRLIAAAVSLDTETPGLDPMERIWTALGQGVRIARDLQTRGVLIAAVLTLKGRGRIVGPLNGDRLFHFGVSEWR